MKKKLTLLFITLLVMSLTIGVFTVTSSAQQFNDYLDINYNSAVDKMVSDGIIKGYPDGNFYPSKYVTRAEMAKMISVYLTGKDIGSQYAGSCTFSDSKKHWAAGYIAYCASKGIINGRSADKFDGNANVTGTEAAKMLLVTIDRNKNKENYTGSSWNANVIKDAIEYSLFKGLVDFNSGEPLMREEAAKMIYNTMKANGKISSTNESEKDSIYVVPYSLAINPTSKTLKVGEGVKIITSISPSKATEKQITWKSSNPSVATVNNGNVIAVGGGTATITATTYNWKTATCKITVQESVGVSKVSISKTSMSLELNQSASLTASVSPANAENSKIYWTSNKPEVATVDGNGNVTAKSAGFAYITAYTSNGKSASCGVTVNKLPYPVDMIGKTFKNLKSTYGNNYSISGDYESVIYKSPTIEFGLSGWGNTIDAYSVICVEVRSPNVELIRGLSSSMTYTELRNVFGNTYDWRGYPILGDLDISSDGSPCAEFSYNSDLYTYYWAPYSNPYTEKSVSVSVFSHC